MAACKRCKGYGWIANGVHIKECPTCLGTGERA